MTFSALSTALGLFLGTFVSEDASCVSGGLLASQGKLTLTTAVLACGLGIFVSDLAIALMSSSMFESAYFGARVFTPMCPSDGLYTPEYLDLLSHPDGESAGDLTAALEQFLQAALAIEPAAPQEKARRRLRRLPLPPRAGHRPVHLPRPHPQ